MPTHRRHCEAAFQAVPKQPPSTVIASSAFGLLAMTTFLLSLLTSSAFAAELAPEGTAERKFQRGLLNVVFSPVEISHSLKEVKDKGGPIPSWIFGMTEGLVNAGIRMVTGAYEVFTAPLPTNPQDRKPIYEPEFALEHLGYFRSQKAEGQS